MKLIFYLFVLFIMNTNMHGQIMANRQTIRLDEAIEAAISNNPLLKYARIKIKAAEGTYLSAISPPSPEVSISREYIPSGKKPGSSEESTLEIKQSFEFPAAYFIRGDLYKKERVISGFDYKSEEIKLRCAVKKEFFTLHSYLEQYKLAAENLAITADFKNKAEIRHSLGEISYLELLTAKVQHTEAQNNLKAWENKVITANSSLNFFIGNGADEQREYLPADIHSLFLEDQVALESLYLLAVQNNPLMKSNELRVSIAENNEMLAWVGLLPGMSVSYMLQSRDGNRGFYGVSFGLTIPVWFFMEHSGKLQEARAHTIMAKENLRSSQNELYLKIKKAFIEWRNENEQVKLYREELLPQADEIYRNAVTSYEAGEISYLEYLQAKQIKINSNSSYINALLAYNIAEAALEEAVGLFTINKDLIK